MFAQTPPEQLCVVRLSSIGDTCHALAVVRAIQDTWPETGITWIIGKTEATLMADIPDIEFIIFDKSQGRHAYSQVRQQLSGREFDVALCMHASLRANLLCRLIPTPLRLGFDCARARDFQWLFTNRRIAPAAREHALEAMMGFARHIGIPPRKLRWDIPLSESQRQFAAGLKDDSRPLLVISPCSSLRARNFRNWSAENYAAAANHARNKFDCTVVLTGGPTDGERQYGQIIDKLCDGNVINLIGKTSLKELFALLGIADVLICPDSGPAHMATAAGTPVIGLYATSNPDRSGPYLSRELCVNRYPEACEQFLGKSPHELRWGQRVRDPGAMGLIRLASVHERIDRALGQNLSR